jgi:hypothetical protein
MDEYFYLDKNRQQQGPVAANELPKYGVTRNSYVWKEGMSNWEKAGSIAELSDICPPDIIATPSISQESPPMEKPNNFLVWSILVTIFCCWPFGIAAIVNSAKVDSLWNSGRYEEAYKAVRNAQKWFWWSFALGIVGTIAYIIFVVLLEIGTAFL